MPEPFFNHEHEILIWTQEEKLYCLFRIVEHDHNSFSCLMMTAFKMLNHCNLTWKNLSLIDRKMFPLTGALMHTEERKHVSA